MDIEIETKRQDVPAIKEKFRIPTTVINTIVDFFRGDVVKMFVNSFTPFYKIL